MSSMKLRRLSVSTVLVSVLFLTKAAAVPNGFFFRRPHSWGFSFGASPPDRASFSETANSQTEERNIPSQIQAEPKFRHSSFPTFPKPPENGISTTPFTNFDSQGSGNSFEPEEVKSFSSTPEFPIDEETQKASGQIAQRPPKRPAAIFFPGQENQAEKVLEDDGFVPECDGVPYMAWNNETLQCQFLMMQTDCADGEWFILDKATHDASCKQKPCVGKQVLYEGVCRDRQGICPEGMEVLVNEYGEAGCDCSVQHVYYARTNRCYPAYRQGPCRLGQYLTLGKDGGECTDNLCFRDGAVFWPQSRRCHRLQDLDDSPCPLGRLDVNVETLHLECADTQLNAIFDLPVVRCSAGSKLDYQGKCKQELFQKFRSSLIQSNRRRGRECGDGFIKAPSGRCLRASGSG